MNPAPAHLESKLRFFWDLSVIQLAAGFVGIMLGFTWAKFGPLHGMAAALPSPIQTVTVGPGFAPGPPNRFAG